MTDSKAPPKPVFQRLKATCVPLLGSASLTPASIPETSRLLSELIATLRDIHASGTILSESLISYTFFPISSILKRNPSADIPNQLLEKILLSLELLCQDWWWTCDTATWQQIFMLSGAILGGLEGPAKQRDDETKEAAVRCLYTLLRPRDEDEEQRHAYFAEPRIAMFVKFARSSKFVPIVGQTLNSLLVTTDSNSLALQVACLRVTQLLISIYLPDALLPSVLPGVVSTTTKLALNSTRRGWANGDLVSHSLRTLAEIVIKSIGDDICTQDGAIRPVQDLEDLITLVNSSTDPDTSDGVPYGTKRTSSWLNGTSSQLHIALNALTPLVKHPSPPALISLAKISSTILSATPTTLPQSQTLLLSFLLSLSINDFPSVSSEARHALLGLLSPSSKAHHAYVQTLMLHTRDNLLALPRLLPLMADAKVEHVAGLVEAVCRLTTTTEADPSLQLNAISSELAKLLGPTGGIEKWGWRLLSVLEFVSPAVVVTTTSSASLMLEHGTDQDWPVFPEVIFKNVSQRSTYVALVKMFHALGEAAGDGCLFSVEWFVGVGQRGSGPRSVAAVWCACRLLEGCAHISLLSSMTLKALDFPKSKRLLNLARALSKSTGHLWDHSDAELLREPAAEEDQPQNDATLEVTHVQGVHQVNETLNITKSASRERRAGAELQPMLHRSLLLQLIAICAGVLQARFGTLFIDTLYPVLHSLVSPISHLSSTALASLSFITLSTSYASIGNLLLSNFDYVLNSVSRRLTRRWLDVDATKVLVIMVRLVGDSIVDKAGDVVEECFDRLDDYHGYHILVEGLIEVLMEVTKVIKEEAADSKPESTRPPRYIPAQDFEEFVEWFGCRHNSPEEEDREDHGPTPRTAWGSDQPDDKPEDTPGGDSVDGPPPTPTQLLTKQIVSRSLYYLTHPSPIIRARILGLLSSSVAVLPGNAVLPSIHSAWPFILNRLSDPEPFVISAAASLIEALSNHVGTFMYRRLWDDVWPRFKVMLAKLDKSDSTSALARHGAGAVGTESAYTLSHRLYRSLLRTMTAAMKGVDPKDTAAWEVVVFFRRFLHSSAHEELQECARDLYIAAAENNPDAVWLGLYATCHDLSIETRSLRQTRWDIEDNAALICKVNCI